MWGVRTANDCGEGESVDLTQAGQIWGRVVLMDCTETVTELEIRASDWPRCSSRHIALKQRDSNLGL